MDAASPTPDRRQAPTPQGFRPSRPLTRRPRHRPKPDPIQARPTDTQNPRYRRAGAKVAYSTADTGKARSRAFCAVLEGVKEITLHARIDRRHTARPATTRKASRVYRYCTKSLPILNRQYRRRCLAILNESLPILNTTREMYIHCISVVFMQGAAGGYLRAGR